MRGFMTIYTTPQLLLRLCIALTIFLLGFSAGSAFTKHQIHACTTDAECEAAIEL
jgi:hypothetical protein